MYMEFDLLDKVISKPNHVSPVKMMTFFVQIL